MDIELKNYSYGRPDASPTDDNKIVAIGSLLSYDVIHSKSIVWGTGTLTRRAVRKYPRLFPLNRSLPIIFNRLVHNRPPQSTILAVRGPITRQLLQDQNISCPEVYGDPAIVLPRYYKPEISNKHIVGLILHHSQEHLLDNIDLTSLGIHLISIKRCNEKEIEQFINEVNSCEKILSSSLHGLIVAQAYNIPAQWIQLRGSPIHSDESHKFYDYFLGANQRIQTPLQVSINPKELKELLNAPIPTSEIEESIIDRLLESLTI